MSIPLGAVMAKNYFLGVKEWEVENAKQIHMWYTFKLAEKAMTNAVLVLDRDRLRLIEKYTEEKLEIYENMRSKALQLSDSEFSEYFENEYWKEVEVLLDKDGNLVVDKDILNADT